MRYRTRGFLQVLLLILGLSMAIYPLYYNKTSITKTYDKYSKSIRSKQHNIEIKLPIFVANNINEYTIKAFLDKYSYFKFDLMKVDYTIEKYRLGFKLNTTFEYVLSKEQEDYVSTRVKEVLTTLDLNNKTDYEKVFILYNWVIDNVSYDSKYYSSYDALKYKKAVCQGYADLFNRLAREAGINSIVTVGELKKGDKTEPHAWNVVEIDNIWYHIDVTSGDTLGDLKYVYFMIPYYQLYYTHILDPVYPPADTCLTDVLQDKKLLEKFKKIKIDYNVYNMKSFDDLVNQIIKSNKQGKTVIRFYLGNKLDIMILNKKLQNYSINIKAVVEPIILNINGETKYLYTIYFTK